MMVNDPEIATRRFIAGAICPACDVTDRIVVETTRSAAAAESLSRRRCVACGFADEFAPLAPGLAQSIPKGRPERRRPGLAEAKPVKILDPRQPDD